MRKPLFGKRVDHVLAKHDAIEADIKERDAVQPPAPVRLETGTRITAVTEGGQAVEGVVGRIYQAPRDVVAGVFRFAVGPAGDDSSEEGRAS
jgi:hypothetical protein